MTTFKNPSLILIDMTVTSTSTPKLRVYDTWNDDTYMLFVKDIHGNWREHIGIGLHPTKSFSTREALIAHVDECFEADCNCP